MSDADLPFSPAADRNKAPVLAVLEQLLPPQACVLEIASGSGQHAAHCATAHPAWRWQPTDGDARSLPGIKARCAGLANVAPPLPLDVLAHPWPPLPATFDAIYCANLLHIAPWATCAALMHGASRHLVPGGMLVLYGPYLVDGEPVAPGNAAFDADLQARDASWGLRRLTDVVAQAQAAGLRFEQRFAMPANNLMLAFRCEPGTPLSPAA